MNSNPNPNYKPPMSKPNNKPMVENIKTIFSFSLSLENNSIDSVFKMCYELYFRLEQTIQFKDFIKHCCYSPLNIKFERKENASEPGYYFIDISVPIYQYLDFISSNEYHNFITKFLSLAKGGRNANYEPKNMRLYSGKVVCVDARTNEFTKGRIYEVKNGRMKTDLPSIVEPGAFSPYSSFEELTNKLSSQFIELVD